MRVFTESSRILHRAPDPEALMGEDIDIELTTPDPTSMDISTLLIDSNLSNAVEFYFYKSTFRG